MSLGNPRNDLHSSLSLFAKQAKHSEPFIHFTHDKIDQPRSLNYDELLQNRTRGSWENEPDKARAYVTDRRATEDAYRKKLKGIGVEHGPDQSFLYATMKDRQRFGDVADGLYKHDVNLSPEDVEQTLFDLVGLPEDQLNPDGPQLGQAGLDAVTKLWDENQENLRDEEYMGMSIRPRIEVITPGIQRKDSAIHGKGLSALLAGLREKSQLAGSRGRAHKYGRPEPEGRDYDRLLLTDDPKEQEQYKRQLEQLIAGGGYTRRDRPDGFLTATSPDEDISVYPTSKLDDIHKAWELIEGGMPKDEAWAALDSEDTVKQAETPINAPTPAAVDRSVDRARRLHDLNAKPIEASELPAQVFPALERYGGPGLPPKLRPGYWSDPPSYGEIPQSAEHLRPGTSKSFLKNLLSGGAYNKAVDEQTIVRDRAAKQTGGQLYSSTPSLGGQIAGHYKNVPGGFQGAIGDAQQKLRERPAIPANPVDARLAAYPTWTPEDLRRPVDNYFIPDVEGTKYLPGTAGVASGFQSNTGNFLVSGYDATDGKHPLDNVGSVPRRMARSGGMPVEEDWLGQTTFVTPGQQGTVEHELTHSAYGGPFSSDPRSRERGSYTPADPTPRWQGVPPRDADGNPNEDYVGQTMKTYSPDDQKSYARQSTPIEMDPRIAEIKRSYAASTGRLVNSPEEAERAWKWWQKKTQKAPAYRGSWRRDYFERTNSDPVERAAALKRMQEIVKTDPQQGGMASIAKTASINFKEDHVMNHIKQLAKLAAASVARAKQAADPPLSGKLLNSQGKARPDYSENPKVVPTVPDNPKYPLIAAHLPPGYTDPKSGIRSTNYDAPLLNGYPRNTLHPDSRGSELGTGPLVDSKQYKIPFPLHGNWFRPTPAEGSPILGPGGVAYRQQDLGGIWDEERQHLPAAVAASQRQLEREARFAKVPASEPEKGGWDLFVKGSLNKPAENAAMLSEKQGQEEQSFVRRIADTDAAHESIRNSDNPIYEYLRNLNPVADVYDPNRRAAVIGDDRGPAYWTRDISDQSDPPFYQPNRTLHLYQHDIDDFIRNRDRAAEETTHLQGENANLQGANANLQGANESQGLENQQLSKWLTNPRFWGGAAVGAGGLAAVYGGKKLYDWLNEDDEEEQRGSQVKQAGSYKSNLGPELAKEIANSRPQNKPGFIPPLPANPPPGAAQVIRNLPALENAMKAFRGIGILPPEAPAKVPAKKPAKGKKMNEETKPIRTAETP